MVDRQKTRLATRTVPIDKIQPQATELEDAVLGALMLEREAVVTITGILTPEMFYSETNRRIFEAIYDLYKKNQAIDILTVTSQLRQSGNLELVGGAYTITSLTNRVTSAANIEFHARIIQEMALRRDMIRIATQAITLSYNDTEDVFDVYQTISEDLFKRFSINASKQAKKFDQIFIERLKAYNTPAVGGLTGVNTGFENINRVCGGWQKTDLIIIAARPGMGKTAFVLNTARKAASEFGQAGVIFSLEMSAPQLVDRMVSAETEIYHEKLKKGTVSEWEWQKMHHASRLIESSMYIDDTASLNIFEFRAKARRLKAQYNIQWIVVDYLQLMHGDKEGNKGGNREQEIGSISRALKSVAKELEVPVLALSQLSRALESRPGMNGKRPLLSDLRESGSIEQDADMVIFLYRPEYYGFTEDENGIAFPQGATEIIFAKNRHGPLDTELLQFNGGFMKFSEFEDSFQPNVGVQVPLTFEPSQSDNAIKPSETFNNPTDDNPPF